MSHLTPRTLAVVGAEDEARRLEKRMHVLTLENAKKRLEIEKVSAQLDGMEAEALSSSNLAVHAATAAQVASAEVRVARLEADAAAARVAFEARQERLQCAQELLDAREAELYETEEAVRSLEEREAARTKEVAATRSELASVESRLLQRTLEAARSGKMADGQAVSLWTSPNALLRKGQGEETDPDAQARVLRQAKSGKADPAEAGYQQFHTLVMGFKLAAGPQHQRLRNLSIEELWEEVRRRRLPRSEWRGFVHEQLLQREAEPSIVERLVGAPAGALLKEVKGFVETIARAPSTEDGQERMARDGTLMKTPGSSGTKGKENVVSVD